MKQLKATQNTAQFGPQSLFLRIIGKLIFMKGAQNSANYVDKLILDFERRGASITKGNGGWIRIDIIKSHESVKLGDDYILQNEMKNDEIEEILFKFFFRKYKEAKFFVQEVEE